MPCWGSNSQSAEDWNLKLPRVPLVCFLLYHCFFKTPQNPSVSSESLRPQVANRHLAGPDRCHELVNRASYLHMRPQKSILLCGELFLYHKKNNTSVIINENTPWYARNSSHQIVSLPSFLTMTSHWELEVDRGGKPSNVTNLSFYFLQNQVNTDQCNTAHGLSFRQQKVMGPVD